MRFKGIKQITIVIAFILAMTMSVSAAGLIFEPVYYFESENVVVKGEATSGSQIIVQVLDTETELSQLKTAENPGNLVFYVDDTIAGENGSFTFNIKLEETGEYTVYVSENGKIVDHNVFFVLQGDYNSLMERLEDMDSDEFFVEVSKAENLNIFGLSADTEFDRTASDFLFGEIKYDGTYKENAGLAKLSSVIKPLNDGNIDNAVPYLKDYLTTDETFKGFMAKHVKNETAEEFFTDAMSKKNIASAEDLNDVAEEALILTAVKYPDGNSNIKTIFEEYKDVLGIDKVSSATSVYKALAGNTYTSIDALVKAYKKAVENASGTGGGGNDDSLVNNNSFNTVIIPGNEATANTEIKMTFDDLGDVAWAYTAISELSSIGIVNGYTKYEFRPNNTVKREEFIKMLVCACGVEADVKSSVIFSDVESGAWYEPYIGAAYNEKITKGVGDGLFGVGREITRQDMTVMIYNAMVDNGYKAKGASLNFTDKDTCAEYAKTAIAELSDMGIINGVGENMFNPLGKATRAEAAVIIYRALSYLR